MKLVKLPQVTDLTTKSRSTVYEEIQKGLMVPPIRLGGNSVAWVESEIIAINCARIAGKPDDQIKELVKQLVADRAKLPSIINGFQSNQQPVEAVQ